MRAIDYASLDSSALTTAERRVVGASWAHRAAQEHLAVGAFSMVAIELATIGCSDVVLSMITEASTDEIRHADICRRYARALCPDLVVPERFAGIPRIPEYPDAPASVVAALHVAEMSCIGETLTGVFFTHMLERVDRGIVRDVVASLLEDEIDHGRLGWAYLAEAAADPVVGQTLARELPHMIERSVGDVLTAKSDPVRDAPVLERFGYFGPLAARKLYRDAVEAVVLAGFDSIGVDTAPARAMPVLAA